MADNHGSWSCSMLLMHRGDVSRRPASKNRLSKYRTHIRNDATLSGTRERRRWPIASPSRRATREKSEKSEAYNITYSIGNHGAWTRRRGGRRVAGGGSIQASARITRRTFTLYPCSCPRACVCLQASGHAKPKANVPKRSEVTDGRLWPSHNQAPNKIIFACGKRKQPRLKSIRPTRCTRSGHGCGCHSAIWPLR